MVLAASESRPLILMRNPFTAASIVKYCSASRARNSRARPREDAMPSLHVSVRDRRPRRVSSPRRSRPMAFNPRYNSGKSASLTHRNTMFCSTVVRTLPPLNVRARSASCQLPRGNVANGQRDRGDGVTRLPLAIDVRPGPLVKPLRMRRAVQ